MSTTAPIRATGRSTHGHVPVMFMHETANYIEEGDYLPKISRFPVETITNNGASTIELTFKGARFTRTIKNGGPGWGGPAFHIERPL